MIPKVTGETVNYAAGRKEHRNQMQQKKENEEPKVLSSNIKNRMMSGFHRTANAFTEYPAKGLKGDINSNFYEFLAMGRVPYLLGSATFIGVFNAASQFFDSRGMQQSKKIGLKLAAGVIFYALAKTLSKDLITRPVSWATGIDIEQPYLNVVYPFPKVILSEPPKPNDKNNNNETPTRIIQDLDPQYQYQKLWESGEFPRIDLVKPEFFDKVAKKNGLGENLNSAENEVKPILKNVISTATTASRVSSFLWAACGVALAACGNWDSYYDTYLSGTKLGKNPIKKDAPFKDKMKARLGNFWQHTKEGTIALKETFKTSAKEFYNGAPGTKGFKKHAGKVLFFTALGSTVFGVANTIIRARNMSKNLCDPDVIDRSKDSMAV